MGKGPRVQGLWNLKLRLRSKSQGFIRVVVKIRVPFWVPSRIRHLLFRVPKKGPSF